MTQISHAILDLSNEPSVDYHTTVSLLLYRMCLDFELVQFLSSIYPTLVSLAHQSSSTPYLLSIN